MTGTDPNKIYRKVVTVFYVLLQLLLGHHRFHTTNLNQTKVRITFNLLTQLTLTNTVVVAFFFMLLLGCTPLAFDDVQL